MEDTTGLLAAELNDLFERIGLVLNKIETKLPPEQCTKCVQSLPAPSLLVFSRLLLMMGKRLQKEPIHIPTDKGNAALNCHYESKAAVNDHREDLCPPSDRGESPSPINDNDTPNEASHSDLGDTVDHSQSHRNSSSPDQRIELYRPLSISTSLYSALIKHQGNPQIFLKSTDRNGAQAAGGLADADELLEEYVRLGRAYNKSAEELGGPGYLLILPLTVTEYQEFSRYFSSAVESLHENGIDEAVTDNGLDVLGEKIADELWASSQETEASLKRPLTKSALRNKRKREAKMNGTEQNEDKRRKVPRQGIRKSRSRNPDTTSIDRPGYDHAYHHRPEASMNRSIIVSLDTEYPSSTAFLGPGIF
ncbi:predicted protein [Histoplasma mississippiense (nom. inval.)]|uniref:predicted protein n=1 Tax=Ajellomyces capsulatus (strain NAm1 / WU24) TaxID=2059318 RepID=UPI000157C714|nr:predicted protein [Histoplasma mississippiense (nom. inval.)]EDN08147.1 predicted protein [Histoplasma mississippiense (nom. inval.)]